jgi:hypothetical protein
MGFINIQFTIQVIVMKFITFLSKPIKQVLIVDFSGTKDEVIAAHPI